MRRTHDATAQPLVLVVEDYQDAREMYAAYLQFSGYRVAEATNGVEAIEKTIELMPDIILMDLALPKMDGWEATRRLEERRADAAHPDRGADRPCAGGARGRRATGRAAMRSSPSRACPMRWWRRSSACWRRSGGRAGRPRRRTGTAGEVPRRVTPDDR